MAEPRKPCRRCAGTDPGPERHDLDGGRGDHGYAPEQFPGDREEPLFLGDVAWAITTAWIERRLTRRPTVREIEAFRKQVARDKLYLAFEGALQQAVADAAATAPTWV